MTEIERKALALLNEVAVERGYNIAAAADRRTHYLLEAICRAIEQREAYKREVSDAVEKVQRMPHSTGLLSLARFILPKPVDPLVEAVEDWINNREFGEGAASLRAALAARGLKIVEADNG